MPTNGLSYPRVVFRTWKGAVAHLVVIYAVILGGIAVRAQRPDLPRTAFLILAGLTLLPLVLSARTLHLLRTLERSRQEPDAAMVALFDLSISIPLMCLTFVASVLWLLR